jgi:hypothetical protein
MILLVKYIKIVFLNYKILVRIQLMKTKYYNAARLSLENQHTRY